MEKLIAYRTSDGKVHLSKREADHHAGNRYGDLLTKLAGEAVQIDKYSKMIEWMENNLSNFQTLLDLNRDLLLPKEDQESEDE
jgi:hypothetical protein